MSQWTEPGIEELGGGIFRVPLPLPNDGLRAVNVYVLTSTDGLLLIDGGWALADSADELERALREIGCELDEIRRFLVTHLHRDHYTQAVALRSRFGATVSLGEGERPNLDRIQDWLTGRQPAEDFAQLRRAGAKPLLDLLNARRGKDVPDPENWLPPDEWLADRSEVLVGDRRLTVIATPGHTRGHVVFHDAAAAQLFAGDHVLPHITPSIGFEPKRAAFPLRDYLDSLRLMFQLPDARLLPAHGPVTDSVHQRVTELLGHHEDRLAASARAVRAGAATGFEVARVLGWTRRQRAFDDLDPFNQLLAVSETAAHLDVLVLQGRLSSATDPDGIELYQ